MSIKLLPFFTVFLLAACGFEPMYGSHAPAPTGQAAPEATLAQVDIGVIPNAEGVYLRNLLIDRFYRNGYPSDPRYSLRVGKINQSIYDLDITIDSEATRRQLTVTTVMQLVDNATGSTSLERAIKAVSTYDVIGSQFTTRIAEQDTLEAALGDIARQIELQLTLYLNRGAPPAPPSALPVDEKPAIYVPPNRPSLIPGPEHPAH